MFAGDEAVIMIKPIATSEATVRQKCEFYELHYVEAGEYCSSKEPVHKTRDLLSKPTLSMLQEPEKVEPAHDMLFKVSQVDSWWCSRSGSFLNEMLWDDFADECVTRGEYARRCESEYAGTINEADSGKN